MIPYKPEQIVNTTVTNSSRWFKGAFLFSELGALAGTADLARSNLVWAMCQRS